MTPDALYDCAEILQKHEDRERDRAAWMVHYILCGLVGSKQAPSIDELRGRAEKVF